jgi:hypothetical protein
MNSQNFKKSQRILAESDFDKKVKDGAEFLVKMEIM